MSSVASIPTAFSQRDSPKTTECACVAPYLGEGRTTVGTSIAISHSAPTFFGGAVSVKATLTAVGAGGRSFTFAVEARDNAGLVAQGTHERFAVDKAKFESKAEERLAM